MARIYISYSHVDKELLLPLTEQLRNRGHEIIMDSQVLKVGQDLRKTLLNELKNADGVLVFITENSLNSKYVLSEIGAARAFVDETSYKKFLIPVIYGDTEIPNIIQDLFCVRLLENQLEATVDLVDQSISSFTGRKEALEEKENTQREKIESKASDYIEITLKALKKRESNNSTIGIICYIIGFSTLVGGVFFAINGMDGLNEIENQNYWIYILVILKSIIIVGLLIACSKYAFNLGKTYMNEGLRNADRAHAISFGKFYLQAFGDKINSPEEIKDIFQNWNIDKDSAFQKLDSNSYDPKFADSLVEIVKNLSDKGKK
jgi:hypothetical protein